MADGRLSALALVLAVSAGPVMAAPGLIPDPQDSAAEARDLKTRDLLAPAAADRGMGDPNAPVRWVIYGSLGCSHCASLMRSVLPRLKKGYLDTGLVYVVWRDFPLTSPDYFAAMAARCRPRAEFFDAIDALLREQGRWSRNEGDDEELAELAEIAGLDQAQMDACLEREDVMDDVVDQREAAEGLGVASTPTSFINGERIVGAAPMADFDRALKRALFKLDRQAQDAAP